MNGTTAQRHYQNILQVFQDYYQLTKPRIIPLLLITTAASMAIASNGKLDPLLLLQTMIGGTCATASAQTINCIYDSDIDYEMERTRNRPMPSGRVQPLHALIFAIALACISFAVLAVFVNLLSALLAMCLASPSTWAFTPICSNAILPTISSLAAQRAQFRRWWVGQR
jgi:heme o synthase